MVILKEESCIYPDAFEEKCGNMILFNVENGCFSKGFFGGIMLSIIPWAFIVYLVMKLSF